MAMAKHTPGPWSLNDDASHPWVVECQTNIPGHLGEVCKVGYLPNARLIAAAPDMLEALRNLLSLFEAIDGGDNDDAPEFIAARAALAKAGVA
jgi:hypothetical protein